MQAYTDDSENVRVEGGMLKITAKAAAVGSTTGVTYYYDDVILVASDGATYILEDLEEAEPKFTTFGGNTTEMIDNPDSSGENIWQMLQHLKSPLALRPLPARISI